MSSTKQAKSQGRKERVRCAETHREPTNSQRVYMGMGQGCARPRTCGEFREEGMDRHERAWLHTCGDLAEPVQHRDSSRAGDTPPKETAVMCQEDGELRAPTSSRHGSVRYDGGSVKVNVSFHSLSFNATRRRMMPRPACWSSPTPVVACHDGVGQRQVRERIRGA